MFGNDNIYKPSFQPQILSFGFTIVCFMKSYQNIFIFLRSSELVLDLSICKNLFRLLGNEDIVCLFVHLFIRFIYVCVRERDYYWPKLIQQPKTGLELMVP